MANREFWEQPLSWFEPPIDEYEEEKIDDEQNTNLQDESEEENNEHSA